MQQYEVVREIFNNCSRNQMRDVFFFEIETDDPDAFARQYCTGGEITLEKSVHDNGTIIYDIVTDGMVQRLGLTPL